MESAGPSKWARRYRCLQVLQKGQNEVVKFPLATLKILFLLGVIRCIYGVVKMRGFIQVVNFNCTVGFLVFLVVAFKALRWGKFMKNLRKHWLGRKRYGRTSGSDGSIDPAGHSRSKWQGCTLLTLQCL